MFRSEAIQARRRRLDGEILLSQPVRTDVLTLALAAIVGLVLLWVAMGRYTRTETVRGLLVTDIASAKIVAIRPGQVAELLVGEGQAVRAGQRLAVIQVEQANEQGSSAIAESLAAIDAQRQVAETQEALAGRREGAEQARLTAVTAGIAAQRADLAQQIGLQQQLVAAAQESLDRILPVLNKGFVSRSDYDRRRQAMLTARQQLAQLQQQDVSLAAEQRRNAAERLRVGTDAASEVATARMSAQNFVQQRAQALAQRAYVLTAPIDGRVAALQTAVGRTADSASPLMTIVPDGSKLHAELYAPTRAIGFVRPGQEVRLLYDAFPYQRFGSFRGRISRVSRTAIDPRDLAAPLRIDEAVYRIEVAPDLQTVDAYGDRLPLQPGMTLTGSLILDRRSFADWLLQPLNAVLRKNGN